MKQPPPICLRDTFNYKGLKAREGELRSIAMKVQMHDRSATAAAIAAGELLHKAKPGLHGRFKPWCLQAAFLEPRRAQLYMNLAELVKKHPRSTIEMLPLCIGLAAAAPSADPERVTEVIDAVKDGKTLTVRQAVGMLRAKPPIVATDTPSDSAAADDPDTATNNILAMLVDKLGSGEIERMSAYFAMAKPASIQRFRIGLKEAALTVSKKASSAASLPRFGRVRTG